MNPQGVWAQLQDDDRVKYSLILRPVTEAGDWASSHFRGYLSSVKEAHFQAKY